MIDQIDFYNINYDNDNNDNNNNGNCECFPSMLQQTNSNLTNVVEQGAVS